MRSIGTLLPSVNLGGNLQVRAPRFFAYFCSLHGPRLWRVLLAILVGDLAAIGLILASFRFMGVLIGMLMLMLICLGFSALLLYLVKALRQPWPLRIVAVDSQRMLHVTGVSHPFLESLQACPVDDPATPHPLTSDAHLDESLRIIQDLEYAEDFEASFCDLYKSVTDLQRIQLRCFWNDRLRFPRPKKFRNPQLPCKMDIQSPEQLQRAALLMAIGRPSDRREALLGIAWHYHTAKLLNLDPDRVLAELSPLASPAVQSAIRDFMQRSPGGKHMKHWGLRLVHSPQGSYIDSCL